MSTTVLHTLLERLRPELDPDQHAQLSFLAGEDVVLGVVELLSLVDRGLVALATSDVRALRRLLENSATA
jgi:hypothetical protein